MFVNTCALGMQYFLTMTVLFDGKPATAMQVSLFSSFLSSTLPPQTEPHSESSTMAMMFMGV